jgi:hypothetical protein
MELVAIMEFVVDRNSMIARSSMIATEGCGGG